MGLMHRARDCTVLAVVVVSLAVFSFATGAYGADPCPVEKSVTNGISPTHIYNAWWANEVDLDGDGYRKSARLYWDADASDGATSYSVYEKIYWRVSGDTLWTYLLTTSPHTIIGNSSGDAVYQEVTSVSHDLLDFQIELYREGESLPDYTRNSDNDVDLAYYPMETDAQDAIATIADAWWTTTVDVNANGYLASAVLSWDPDVVGSAGSVTVHEKFYFKNSVSDVWMELFPTTSPHTIAGTSPADVQVALNPTTSGSKLMYDFRIEIYREGETRPDYMRDCTNDPDLNDVKWESTADDNAATLTVNSSPISGIVISGTPAGTTTYSSTSALSTPQSITAPSSLVRSGRTYWFVRWKLNGVNQALGSRTLSLTLNTDTTATAVYKAVRYHKIIGPSSVRERTTTNYKCLAYFTDGTSKYVTSLARWSESCSYARFSSPGRLVTSSVSANKLCKMTVSYGGKKATKTITIVNR